VAALAVSSTRRDFIALLLGAPLAAACGGTARGLPDGVVVDTGMARGHRMRDTSVPNAVAARRHRVAIVGGGIAGLAAAWELRRRGVRDVVVLELGDRVGGTARGDTSPVTPYPWGAHYIVAPEREQTSLIALLDELGAVERYERDGTPILDEALRCRDPEERVFYRGRWYDGLYLHAGESSDDVRELAAFLAEIDRWARWRDARGRPAFAIPSARCSDDTEPAALDRITWLDAHGWRSERLRWLCDYACRDDYGLTAATTSAWAGVFYFAARAKSGASATASSQSVVTWPDGNFALARHLATGVRVELGATVAAVEPSGRVTGFASDGGAFAIEAERVILATPSFVTDRLVRSTAMPAGDYGAWAVANLHLRDRPRARHGEPAAWDNVLHDSASLGYVSATHQRGRDRGATVWTWYYPFVGDGRAARASIAGAGQPEWAAVVLADLERAHPDVRDLTERIDVAFWGHGMIRPRPGTIFDPMRRARAAPRERLHFAHTDLSGLALFEEAFDHGVRAAGEVVEALA
jgi:flavin-dependent dehydrogenase